MSSIVIKGNTSGQIEIAAPAVAGTNTLTLPATTGTILDTNSSLPAANLTGTIAGSALPVGSILQVVQAIGSEVQLNSTGGSNQVILTASITPSSSSNKILVFAGTQVHTDTTGAAYWTLNLHRDSPDIANVANAAGYQKTGGERDFTATIKLDSPATTSSITYTIKASPTNSGTIRFNYSNNGYITLLEVAA